MLFMETFQCMTSSCLRQMFLPGQAVIFLYNHFLRFVRWSICDTTMLPPKKGSGWWSVTYDGCTDTVHTHIPFGKVCVHLWLCIPSCTHAFGKGVCSRLYLYHIRVIVIATSFEHAFMGGIVFCFRWIHRPWRRY